MVEDWLANAYEGMSRRLARRPSSCYTRGLHMRSMQITDPATARRRLRTPGPGAWRGSRSTSRVSTDSTQILH